MKMQRNKLLKDKGFPSMTIAELENNIPPNFTKKLYYSAY